MPNRRTSPNRMATQLAESSRLYGAPDIAAAPVGRWIAMSVRYIGACVGA